MPHISGPRDVDVAFGLAYAHAEDYYPTIQEVTLATRGTHQPYIGPVAWYEAVLESAEDWHVAGDTLIMFVSWDKNGHLKSESVHQFGSATLDESSPHFADQLPLFVEEKTKPVLFTQAQQQG